MKTLVWVRGALLLMLLTLCTVMSLSWGGNLVDNGSVTLYLPEEKLNYSTLLASEARTSEPVPFALWRQQEGIELTNAEFKRSRRVSLITVFGDSTIPLPSLPMLLPDSGLACLLDSNSSYELFGDAKAVGGKLTIDGRQYTIVGVFDWPSGMVVRQGRDEQDAACDRITLALTGAENKTQAADEFAMRHGMLPFASARLGFQIDMADFIPSRWSDFEFWGSAIAQLRQQLWQMLVLPKELPQAIPMSVLMHRGVWSTLGLVLLVPLIFCCRDIVKGVQEKELSQ